MRPRAQIPMLFLALAAALPACTSNDSKLVDADKFPAEYKAEIVTTLKNLFVRYSAIKVSGAALSEPVLSPSDKGQIYTACVRYVAHGSNPGDTTQATRVAYFFAGHLNQLVAAKEGQCEKAAYKPFPELNEVCIGKGCEAEPKGFRLLR